jgi:RsiW-degrading membrane proteinase PrsW (M82 family)
MHEFASIAIGAVGGFLPAILWLWFWLHEDRTHPEPRSLILLAFLAGLCAVPLVIPLQKISQVGLEALGVATGSLGVYIVWSFLEEITKYAVAWFAVLRRRAADEPIDMVVYMIVVALGFAAAENALFLLSPLGGDTYTAMLLTGNFRFIGATLLHTLASASVGVILAFSFYQPRRTRRMWAIVGVILAGTLHSAFNFLILQTPGTQLLRTFTVVWIGVVVLLAIIERVKKVHRKY